MGGVYAAQAASEWHRVRLEEVAEEDCLCMFLDHGDTDRVAKQDLRQLQPEFLLLPPQALTVEVAGLEDFQDRVAVLPTVNQLLLGKSLVARVEDNFLKLCTSEARNSHAWLASEIFSSMSRWAENGHKHANLVCVQKLWSLLHF